MERYSVSKLHPLYGLFISSLKNAIFECCPEDLLYIEQVLKQRGLSEKQIASIPSSYFSSKIRRRIPEKETVSKRVNDVIMMFRKIDPVFINDKVMKEHQNNMKHLLKGCLSDYPGIELYSEHVNFNCEFIKLKSARGSSALEGFHFFVADATAGKMIAPLLFDTMLEDMVYRWNVDRCIIED